ncbi:MAG: aminopeptidase [Bacteriovoracaceae bacterium]
MVMRTKQLKIFILLMVVLLSLFSGCSRLDYVIEQGSGQMMLQNKSRKNKDVLKDKRIPQDYKNKITKIEAYKKHFYQYFGEEEKGIYSRTTMLKGPAATYLVITSPYNEIKAKNTCFPIAGCFPYLGFFDPESATRFQEEMKSEHLVTYKRPVYAYSTLGFFEDTILSSFFYFDDFDLAELIFHELFHTIFFAKNEVDLNEALANYVGMEMAKEYFKFDTFKAQEMAVKAKKRDALYSRLVKHSEDLNLLYQKEVDLSEEKAKYILDTYLENTFFPDIRKVCGEQGLTDAECFPLRGQWNNATFAAYMTYEKDIDFIEKVRAAKGLDLKGLLVLVKADLERYQKESHPDEENFARFILRIENIK